MTAFVLTNPAFPDYVKLGRKEKYSPLHVGGFRVFYMYNI